MEKTPRRSSLSSVPASSGSASSVSVVVDPNSQVPGPSSSRSGGSGAAALRRKAETTLVLQARRVDTLRRQVSERHRAQVAGRRRQVVLWALAGAGAVLLGGWLATRLSPPRADELEAPLVLGRTEADGSVALPHSPSHPAGQRSPNAGKGEGAPQPTSPRSGVASNPGGAVRSGAPSTETDDEGAATQVEPQAGSERSPDEPKTVGDWGDGFDSANQRKSRRAATNDAVNLDELPTE